MPRSALTDLELSNVSPKSPSRWHPVVLPDDYIRKMKQDLAEADAMVESKTRYEPDPDFSPPPDDDPPA